MIRFAFCASLVLLASSASAFSSTQTDWSGGPGLPGPVNQWTNRFHACSGVIWGLPGLIEVMAWQNHLVSNSNDYSNDAQAIDVDMNGTTDILGIGSGNIDWWSNVDGSGSLWEAHSIASTEFSVSSVATGDIDGDGDPDVAAAFFSGDLVKWWENTDGAGTSWSGHDIDSAFDAVRSVCLSDLDSDGDLDVVAGGDSEMAIWWENLDGSGIYWEPHLVTSSLGDVNGVFPGDINEDGFADILTATDHGVYWLENKDGSALSWVERKIGSGLSYWAAHADVDGDGDEDAIGAFPSADAIFWWENADGSGTSWVGHNITSDFNYACAVAAADMDGDGDMDILGGAHNEQHLCLFENLDGEGGSWHQSFLEPGYDGVWAVAAADVNSDGSTDFIGAFGNSKGIRWWDRLTGSVAASLESSILYLRCDPDWNNLAGSMESPPGTEIAFLVRASDNPGDMGQWSDTLTAPCSLEGILEDDCSYLQYMVLMSADDISDTSPRLLSLTFNYGSVELADEHAGLQPFYCLEGVSPNPSNETSWVRFVLPQPADVRLSVYDIAGRLVVEYPLMQSETIAGLNTLALEGLSPGLYFCRIASGSFSDSTRFTVIE